MWDSAVVFTYGNPIPGREARAFEAFSEAMAFFGKLAAKDECSQPEPFLRASGGMMIVRGEMNSLMGFLSSSEGVAIINKASLTAVDFDYQLYAVGDRLVESMQGWMAVGGELGYV